MDQMLEISSTAQHSNNSNSNSNNRCLSVGPEMAAAR